MTTRDAVLAALACILCAVALVLAGTSDYEEQQRYQVAWQEQQAIAAQR